MPRMAFGFTGGFRKESGQGEACGAAAAIGVADRVVLAVDGDRDAIRATEQYRQGWRAADRHGAAR